MTPADFLFGAFSLLLGLAIAEALGAIGRMAKWRARAARRAAPGVSVGPLLPLQAVVVVLHQTYFWIAFASVLDSLPLNYLVLLALLAVVGGYYLLSSMLFPDEPDDWPDLDAYYFAHRRLVWFGVIAIGLVSSAAEGVWSAPYDPDEARRHPTATALADLADDVGTLALLALLRHAPPPRDRAAPRRRRALRGAGGGVAADPPVSGSCERVIRARPAASDRRPAGSSGRRSDRQRGAAPCPPT